MSSRRENTQDEIESANAVNQYRKSKRLPPLQLDIELSQLCDNLNEQRIDDVDEDDQETLDDRLKKIPDAVTGDELTVAFPVCENPGLKMTDIFIHSPDHAEIYRDNYTHIGISIVEHDNRVYGVQFIVKKLNKTVSEGMTEQLRKEIQRELLNVLNTFRQEYKKPVLKLNQEISDLFAPQCTKFVQREIEKLLDGIDDILDEVEGDCTVRRSHFKNCEDSLLEILKYYSNPKHHSFLRNDFDEIGISVDSYNFTVGVILALIGDAGEEDTGN